MHQHGQFSGHGDLRAQALAEDRSELMQDLEDLSPESL
jgi:hypothetical protein